VRLQRERRPRLDVRRAARLQPVPGGLQLVDAVRAAGVGTQPNPRSHIAQRLIAEGRRVQRIDAQRGDVDLQRQIEPRRGCQRRRRVAGRQQQVEARGMQLGQCQARPQPRRAAASHLQIAPAEAAQHDAGGSAGQRQLHPLRLEITEQPAARRGHVDARQPHHQPGAAGFAAQRPPQPTGQCADQQRTRQQTERGAPAEHARPAAARLRRRRRRRPQIGGGFGAQNAIPTLRCKRNCCTFCP
jgi:hypothetical protein